MRKYICMVMLLVALLIPLSVQAAPCSPKAMPSISFNGTTAICSVAINSSSLTDSISLTAKLYQGSDCIATWTDSGTGYLNFSRSKRVQKGKTYKLIADVTINGEALDTASATGTCS